MKKTINFHPDATIEQRKRAINEAMESDMPFELKRILLDIPRLGMENYTGGSTQMLLARAAVIQYSKKICTTV